MDPDEQLRARLARLSERDQPDLEQQFDAVVHAAARRRRSRGIRAGLGELVATIAIVVLAFVGIVVRNGGTAAPAPLQLASVPWTTTLSASDHAVASEGVGGTWTMTLPASGAVDLVAPPTYLLPTTGYRFRVNQDQVVMGLFVERCAGLDPGTYRYAIDGETLRFTLVDDPCAHRATVLTSAPWHAASEP